ncbi:hypothetical protein [Micromonospora sp. NPDC004551]|uniref:hypothetical protein n=1 Tax=Micromonospora sp. NPDC004551 TaxID=3154284 RepID=UPI0033B8E124
MPIPAEWLEVQSAPGYVVCAHRPCTKKARPYVTDHVCCGKPEHNAAHEAARAPRQPPAEVYGLGDLFADVASGIRRRLGRGAGR